MTYTNYEHKRLLKAIILRIHKIVKYSNISFPLYIMIPAIKSDYSRYRIVNFCIIINYCEYYAAVKILPRVILIISSLSVVSEDTTLRLFVLK